MSGNAIAWMVHPWFTGLGSRCWRPKERGPRTRCFLGWGPRQNNTGAGAFRGALADQQALPLRQKPADGLDAVGRA